MRKLSEINEGLWSSGIKRSQTNKIRREEIEDFFNNMVKYKKYIKNYTINDDGSVDIDGDLYLDIYEMFKYDNKIPFKLGKISGGFRCGNISFESFDNFPDEVGKDFICNRTKITSLVGCPQKIGSDFYCQSNPALESLDGCPKKVGGMFCIMDCKVKFTKDEIKKRCDVGGNILT